MIPSRSGGPWYGSSGTVAQFEAAARRIYPGIYVSRERNRRQAGRVYRLEVDVPHYDSRRIEIRFIKERPRDPVIRVDGPDDSPHRYRSGELCVWEPTDPPQDRWVVEDGLLHLIGLVVVHLFKEAWWRCHGEWLGRQAPHAAKTQG